MDKGKEVQEEVICEREDSGDEMRNRKDKREGKEMKKQKHDVGRKDREDKVRTAWKRR